MVGDVRFRWEMVGPAKNDYFPVRNARAEREYISSGRNIGAAVFGFMFRILSGVVVVLGHFVRGGKTERNHLDWNTRILCPDG